MFQVQMEECLLSRDSSHLVSVLQYEGLTNTTLTKLNQLVTKCLCGSEFSKVQVVLKSLEILSESRDDLQTFLSHGLTAKVVLWFEAVHDSLTSDLNKGSDSLTDLTEEFYDYFLRLGQASLPVSQLSVVLLHLAKFSLEPAIPFPLRLEAIRTFNSILESLSREQRRLIQDDRNQDRMLTQIAEAVLTVGDYELQVSLSESLCRLTPRRERQQRAREWFSPDISSAFCNIIDRDFEVDCRRFLNFVNCHQGNKRRVYTFPCLTAFLDSTELFPPKDDKLDSFWIDFNTGSECVSFFTDDPQNLNRFSVFVTTCSIMEEVVTLCEGFLWGSIHLPRENVDYYSLQVKHDGCTEAQMLLSIYLNSPIMHHNTRGQKVELSFSCEHQTELEEAAGRVLMKGEDSLHVKDTGQNAETIPPQKILDDRAYNRKTPKAKSQLKILPLSSSSGEDSPITQTPRRSQAEVLFDQIRHSTPSYGSGVLVGAELDISQRHTEELEGSGCALQQEVCSTDWRRASDSGYLESPTEGTPAQKRKVDCQLEREGSVVATDCSPTEVGPSAKAGLICEGVESYKKEEPVTDPGVTSLSDLTTGITAAFKTFKTQLEEHFNERWPKIESEILLSLKMCQQQVSTLFTAVHQHRLLLLQRIEKSITDPLTQLINVDSMDTEILNFFQSELQRVSCFCNERLQRLKRLEKGASENPSSQ